MRVRARDPAASPRRDQMGGALAMLQLILEECHSGGTGGRALPRGCASQRCAGPGLLEVVAALSMCISVAAATSSAASSGSKMYACKIELSTEAVSAVIVEVCMEVSRIPGSLSYSACRCQIKLEARHWLAVCAQFLLNWICGASPQGNYQYVVTNLR